MNVILVKDIEKLGAQGEVVKVRPGYARNYLIPAGFAVAETEQQRRALKELMRQREQKHARDLAKAQELKKQLEAKKWTLKLNTGADDKSFGAITANDIIELLSQGEVTLDKHAVQLGEPIKTLGVHPVPVRVHPEVVATVKLSVVKA